MRSPHKLLILAAVAVSTTWLSGCIFGSDNSGPSAEETKKSNDAATRATGDLESNVARMQNGPYSYGKEDLTALKNSNSQFAEAVRLNPGNSKAQLGLAVTGVLLAAQSPKLSTVINQTVEGQSPFEPKLTEDAPLKRMAVLQKVAVAAQTWPEFHAVQDSIAQVLLPALEEAITHLQVAYDDPNFTMTMTIDGKPRELDHAEAGILLAGFHAIHGLVTLWLSYDIDVDDNGSYDYISGLDGLDTVKKFTDLTAEQRASLNVVAKILGPTSPFMAVRPTWKAKLAAVDGEIKSALDIIKESVASIGQESDDQSNDLLHICATNEFGQCIDGGDYQQAKDIIDSARKYINQPYVFKLTALDTVVRVNFAAYFNVQDYKKMLPYYGFYNANQWSDEKPVLFFTDAAGHETGNIMDLKRIADDADANSTPAATVIASLRAIIHLQDPTFQGFLPGATEADIWNIILKQAQYDEQNSGTIIAYGLQKRGAHTLRPNFALSLLGK